MIEEILNIEESEYFFNLTFLWDLCLKVNAVAGCKQKDEQGE